MIFEDDSPQPQKTDPIDEKVNKRLEKKTFGRSQPSFRWGVRSRLGSILSQSLTTH
jgi:hypothetical protein